MSKVKVTPFEVADYLTDEEKIRLYLEDILKDDDPVLFYKALCDISKSKGMENIEKKAGVTQKEFQDTLAEFPLEDFCAIINMFNALGFKFKFTAKKQNPSA